MLIWDITTPAHDFCTGFSSPPLESGRVPQTSKYLRSMCKVSVSQDIAQERTGLDGPTSLELEASPSKSQKERLDSEPPLKAFDSQLLPIQPVSIYESAREIILHSNRLTTNDAAMKSGSLRRAHPPRAIPSFANPAFRETTNLLQSVLSTQIPQISLSGQPYHPTTATRGGIARNNSARQSCPGKGKFAFGDMHSQGR